MPDSMYERGCIITEVQTRFAVKQREGAANPVDVTMAYFTGPLGSEPIKALFRHEDSSTVAMDMDAAYRKLAPRSQGDFLEALSYGVAGVLAYQLGRTAFEPWTTEKFMSTTYDLFFAKAHLERPALEIPEAVKSQTEAQLLGQDVLVSMAIREKVMPSNGTAPGKIGDFFRDINELNRLPSVTLLLNMWMAGRITQRVLIAGRDFQATVDAIAPKEKPKAKNFLADFDL